MTLGIRVGVFAAAAALLAACGGGSGATVSGAAPSALQTTPAPRASSSVAPSSTPPTTGAVTASQLTVTPAGTATVTASPAPAPTPTHSPSATHPASNNLTESDAGSTVHVHIGDQINVQLGPAFHQPVSSNSAVVQRASASGGYGTGQDARATFTALAKGTADLSSYDDYACLHTTPRCAIAQREWIVHVVVD